MARSITGKSNLNTFQPNTTVCSVCFVEAIQSHDSGLLNTILSIPNARFVETFCLPLPQFLTSIYSLPAFPSLLNLYSSHCSPPTSSQSSKLRERYNECLKCGHEFIDPEMRLPIVPAVQPSHVAVSVLAVAMLASTPRFNALRMLLESGKFDAQDTLVFHQACDERGSSLSSHNLRARAPLADASSPDNPLHSAVFFGPLQSVHYIE